MPPNTYPDEIIIECSGEVDIMGTLGEEITITTVGTIEDVTEEE